MPRHRRSDSVSTDLAAKLSFFLSKLEVKGILKGSPSSGYIINGKVFDNSSSSRGTTYPSTDAIYKWTTAKSAPSVPDLYNFLDMISMTDYRAFFSIEELDHFKSSICEKMGIPLFNKSSMPNIAIPITNTSNTHSNVNRLNYTPIRADNYHFRNSLHHYVGYYNCYLYWGIYPSDSNKKTIYKSLLHLYRDEQGILKAKMTDCDHGCTINQYKVKYPNESIFEYAGIVIPISDHLLIIFEREDWVVDNYGYEKDIYCLYISLSENDKIEINNADGFLGIFYGISESFEKNNKIIGSTCASRTVITKIDVGNDDFSNICDTEKYGYLFNDDDDNVDSSILRHINNENLINGVLSIYNNRQNSD